MMCVHCKCEERPLQEITSLDSMLKSYCLENDMQPDDLLCRDCIMELQMELDDFYSGLGL